MEQNTVTQLKAMAKDRGLKGYSKLRKAELINLLNDRPPPHVPVQAQVPALAQVPAQAQVPPRSSMEAPRRSLQDEPVPDNGVPTFQPGKYLEPGETKSRIGKTMETAKKTLHGWYDWLVDHVPKTITNPWSSFKKRVMSLYKEQEDFEVKESKSALTKFTKQYTIEGREGYDPKTFLSSCRGSIVDLLRRQRGTKVKLILKCIMEKTSIATGDIITIQAGFRSKIQVNLEGTDVKELYEGMVGMVLENMANYQRQGSGWRFKSLISLDIHTVKYEPIKGSSYIPLPPKLAKKKAIINLKNKDDHCFKWCVTRALHPLEKNSERITQELKEQSLKFNWNNITFPVDLKAIDRFERQNATISVNVFGYEREVYPLRISKHKHENTINLLLISDDEKQHYCLIKNMSRLLSTQTSKHGHEQHFCLQCLNPFNSKESLQKHNEYCSSNEAVKIELPKPGTTLHFKNYVRSMRVPFVVYADFESFTHGVDTCQPHPNESYTKKYQKHAPSGFCYYIKCFDDSVYSQELVEYTKQSEDEDVAQIFVDKLEQNIKDIYTKFKFPKKMIYTKEDKRKFKEATKCWICKEDLGDDKVRDHCHLTGMFRGAAHNKCNLQYRMPKFIPVIFHNLSGYDSHLFIKNLGVSEGNISCIPNNEEKYISFTKTIVVNRYENKEGKEVLIKRDLRFIDSFKFMASSLSSLVNNLNKDKFTNMNKLFQGKHLDMLLRKGVFPYDHVDCLQKLEETQLPPKEAFYSRLNDETITDEDYMHAQTVWKVFGMKTIREYHDLYLKSDVLLLADVFENFRDVCLKNYDLDPAWYYTSPGLAWDAALKLTAVQLELLSDPDMLLMIEKGIRGGISTISNRYGKANNPYMQEDFDSKNATKYLTYLDANNLYGWAMSKPLPTHGFEWMSEEDLANWKSRSCILEVDLEYPKHLHDQHNDYPLAPESITVNKIEKLIPNLNNKTKYVVHYENLKLYESLGLKITKIHRGIKFEESSWLKQYIDLNTNLRSNADNEFEKDFFKLMNNSVFGKTMENIRNRVNIQLVNSEAKARKLASKPNYQHCTIFNENLVAVHMKKTRLVFDKPVYLGMCILDLSKTLMYDFHYNYIKAKYGEKAKLLFTDTDSLAYEIETSDFYKDIGQDVERMFDTSNYPKDHPSGIKSGINKKVVGMFKDEAGGEIMKEFVGLRAKLYSYKMMEGKEEKKCKGVKKAVVRKSITFDDYKTCLFSGKEQMRTMNVIRSYRHEIHSEEVNKVALSANDDKRVIMEDGIHTRAYGHWRLS